MDHITISSDKHWFWGFFEDKPADGFTNGEEDNKLLGLIGIIMGHLAPILMIIGFVYPGFAGGAAALGWWTWIFVAVGAIILGFELYGLVLWIFADEDPNKHAIFRTWRWNFLFHGISAIAHFAAMVTILIIVIVAGTFATEYVGFILVLLSFLFAAGALVLIMFGLKGWWYNWDPEGELQYNMDWSLFGTDPEDHDDDMDDMEDEEEVAEDEDTEDAEEDMDAEDDEW